LTNYYSIFVIGTNAALMYRPCARGRVEKWPKCLG
jgi:hypothetical protein